MSSITGSTFHKSNSEFVSNFTGVPNRNTIPLPIPIPSDEHVTYEPQDNQIETSEPIGAAIGQYWGTKCSREDEMKLKKAEEELLKKNANRAIYMEWKKNVLIIASIKKKYAII